MITKRPANERGPMDAGWLKSMHTFSFGHYYDSHYMGYGPLRVINDDHVVPGAGFETHPHKNMEIISYVLEGELAHKDSMGNGSTIRKGEVQIMSAGSGLTHSEFNASNSEGVNFLQMWILPDVQNTEPRYQQHMFASDEMQNQFRVVISPDEENGSLHVKQDARLLIGRFDNGQSNQVALKSGRKYWVHVATGEVSLNGHKASGGDAFALEGEKTIDLEVVNQAEVLVFDLPA